MDRFRYFRKFFERLTGREYPLEADAQCLVQTFEPDKIQFLVLNTAWQTDKLQEKIGSLNPDAVALAIQNVSRTCLPIAVWHHAQSEWEDGKKIKFAYRLEEAQVSSLADAGVRCVLHGHVHERISTVVNPYYQLRNRLHFVGGGAFGAAPTDRAPGVPTMYNLIEIARDRNYFTVSTRSRAEGHSHFDAHPMWPVPGEPDRKTATLRVDLS